MHLRSAFGRRFAPSSAKLAAAAALAFVACKTAAPHSRGSAVKDDGAAEAFDLSKTEPMDFSFLLPQITQANLDANLFIRASETGQCGEGAGCGPLFSFEYLQDIAAGLANRTRPEIDFNRAKGLDLDGSPEKLREAYDSLFVSGLRYDPCAPTAHVARDDLSPAKNKFSTNEQCEREFRLVIQRWKGGKPADQGFHIGMRLTADQSRRLLGDLLKLKQFAEKNGISTVNRPIELHAALADSSPIRVEFFNRVKKLIQRHAGDKITKAVAVMITLPIANGTRWQWSITTRAPQVLGPQTDPVVHFGGKAVILGTPNVKGNKFITERRTFVSETGDDTKTIRAVGFEATKVGAEAQTRLDPESTVVPDLIKLSNPTLVKDPQKLPDAKALEILNTAVKMENPFRATVAPRKEAAPLEFVGECSACHIETPSKLRYMEVRGDVDETTLSEHMPSLDTTITTQLPEAARSAYLKGAQNAATNYVVLNFAWHELFGGPVHPSINQRTANEAAEVVRYIRENSAAIGPIVATPDEP
jgi:hypothetical protein